ncbi:hypothetical protein GCM10027614_03460 [Micromonospora vulcania]
MPDVSSPTTTRPRSVAARAVRLVLATTLVAGGVVAGTTGPAQAANPYERGPAPTTAILEASRGPFATSSQNVSALSVTGFGGGVIYYPTSTSEGTFGAIAISPGFTAYWSSISWLGRGSPRTGSW